MALPLSPARPTLPKQVFAWPASVPLPPPPACALAVHRRLTRTIAERSGELQPYGRPRGGRACSRTRKSAAAQIAGSVRSRGRPAGAWRSDQSKSRSEPSQTFFRVPRSRDARTKCRISSYLQINHAGGRRTHPRPRASPGQVLQVHAGTVRGKRGQPPTRGFAAVRQVEIFFIMSVINPPPRYGVPMYAVCAPFRSTGLQYLSPGSPLFRTAHGAHRADHARATQQVHLRIIRCARDRSLVRHSSYRLSHPHTSHDIPCACHAVLTMGRPVRLM